MNLATPQLHKVGTLDISHTWKVSGISHRMTNLVIFRHVHCNVKNPKHNLVLVRGSGIQRMPRMIVTDLILLYGDQEQGLADQTVVDCRGGEGGLLQKLPPPTHL